MKPPAPDLSYFRLSLMDFLKESHPERLQERRFILSCADAATEAYRQTILSGHTTVEAAEQANTVLFKDLLFSRYDTLVNILWNEFPDEVPEDQARSLAMQLMPECEPLFAQYPLSDDFAYDPQYELLYTELTGAIAIYLEGRGIQ